MKQNLNLEGIQSDFNTRAHTLRAGAHVWKRYSPSKLSRSHQVPHPQLPQASCRIRKTPRTSVGQSSSNLSRWSSWFTCAFKSRSTPSPRSCTTATYGKLLSATSGRRRRINDLKDFFPDFPINVERSPPFRSGLQWQIIKAKDAIAKDKLFHFERVGCSLRRDMEVNPVVECRVQIEQPNFGVRSWEPRLRRCNVSGLHRSLGG